MKKILITGANSYIGTSFEKYMKEFDGYEIDTVDMIDGSWREKDFSKYDVVFHVAGIAHSDTKKTSEDIKKKYYAVNMDLTVDTAKKNKSKRCWSIYLYEQHDCFWHKTRLYHKRHHSTARQFLW